MQRSRSKEARSRHSLGQCLLEVPYRPRAGTSAGSTRRWLAGRRASSMYVPAHRATSPPSLRSSKWTYVPRNLGSYLPYGVGTYTHASWRACICTCVRASVRACVRALVGRCKRGQEKKDRPEEAGTPPLAWAGTACPAVRLECVRRATGGRPSGMFDWSQPRSWRVCRHPPRSAAGLRMEAGPSARNLSYACIRCRLRYVRVHACCPLVSLRRGGR